MMLTSYLIAHKVRGEPAFDIAIRMCGGEVPCQPNCGLYKEGKCKAKEEDWWIIPTSGHRAYPYWQIKIDAIVEGCQPLAYCPSDWPDHYSINDRKHYQAIEEDTELSHEAATPGTGTFDASSLLERLGLLRKATIRRR